MAETGKLPDAKSLAALLLAKASPCQRVARGGHMTALLFCLNLSEIVTARRVFRCIKVTFQSLI